MIYHWDGATWSTSVNLGALYSLWGSGPTDVFAVGANGTIVHYNGVTWSPMISGTTSQLVAVGGTGPNDVFAGGTGGLLLHYDGTDWTPLRPPTSADLTHIQGRPEGVYVLDVTGKVMLLERSQLPWP